MRERQRDLIARTEIMTAPMNTGRIQGWKQQAEMGFLDTNRSIKEWLSSVRACDVCKEMNGAKVQGLDSMFDTEAFGKVASPPCHPHCRCTVLVHPVRSADPVPER